MKTLRIASLLSLFMAFAIVPFAQTKSETIPVSGNCGMCKSNIEKAAKKGGATTASWDKGTKILTIKYNSSTTNAGKIQQSVADAGYDTRDIKASDEAYNKLHACCQYDRATATTQKASCCDGCNMKDGKCTDMSACKDKACCKDAETCKAKGCCSDGKAEASRQQ